MLTEKLSNLSSVGVEYQNNLVIMRDYNMQFIHIFFWHETRIPFTYFINHILQFQYVNIIRNVNYYVKKYQVVSNLFVFS